MKRSEINGIIKEAISLLDKHHFKLPRFAYWTMEEWEQHRNDIDTIREVMLGWDITDYGLNDFDKFGFSLITIRNGNRAMEENYPKVYAEKLFKEKM